MTKNDFEQKKINQSFFFFYFFKHEKERVFLNIVLNRVFHFTRQTGPFFVY